MSTSDRARRLLGALGICATVAAGVLAATALPASAKNPKASSAHAHARAHEHAWAKDHTYGKGEGDVNDHAKGNDHAYAKGEGDANDHANGKGKDEAKGHANVKGEGKGNGNAGTKGNSVNAHEHVTICHATPPDTAANGYVRISPSASGVFHGHLHEHAADIIPPFTYNGQTYSLNWDATGQAIWNNGCATPATTTTTTTVATPTPTPKRTHNVRGKSHRIVIPFIAPKLHVTKKGAVAFVEVEASVKAMFAALNHTKAHRVGGVLAASKTITHRARPARAVTRGASFTG